MKQFIVVVISVLLGIVLFSIFNTILNSIFTFRLTGLSAGIGGIISTALVTYILDNKFKTKLFNKK